MARILVVLRGALDRVELRKRYASVSSDGNEIAVCLVLPPNAASLADGLEAQRALTRALREDFGEDAEGVTVLVASDHEGYRVEDCAREWGATEVLA